MQKEQFRHDRRNHADILNLHKTDRLKHYGLHYAKYVGRLARGDNEIKDVSRTIVDALLVCLSAANTLHQRLILEKSDVTVKSPIDVFMSFADAVGRFADACEKVDHLEPFMPLALQANSDVLRSIYDFARLYQVDMLQEMLVSRRLELKERQFYIDDSMWV